MKALFQSAYLGLTLDAAIEKWAPSSENNHAAYLKNVVAMTGLDPQTILTPENVT